MNCKFIRKTKGAIAVFLTLIMLGMVVFEGLMIDTSRIIAAKTVTSGAGDLALNSALTGYDKVLYEVYGLFASATDEADLDSKINDYFNQTLQGAGIDGSLDDINNMLNLMMASGSSVSLQGVNGSQLSNEDVIQEQILQYMKFRAPVNIGFGFLEKLESFKDFNKQSEAMEAQMTFEEKLESLQDACQNVYDKANALKKHDETKPITSYNTDNDTWNRNDTQFCNIIYWYVDLLKKFNNETGEDYTEWPNKVNGKELVSEEAWKGTETEFNSYYDINLLIDFEKRANSQAADSRLYDAYSAMLTNNYDWARCDYNFNMYNDFVGYYEGIEQVAGEAIILKNDIRELYWLLKNYNNWYTTVVERSETIPDEKKAEYENFNQIYKDKIRAQISKIESCSFSDRFTFSTNKYEAAMKIKYDELLHDPIYNAHESLVEGIKKAEELIKAIDCESHTSSEEDFCCLARAIQVTETYKNKWNGKIDALGDSSTKSSMKATFNSEAEGIDSSKYQDLLQCVNSAKAYYENFKVYTENIFLQDTQYEYPVYQTISEELNWIKLYQFVEDNGADKIRVKKKDLPASPSDDLKTQIENDSFYKYLKNICVENEVEESDSKEDKKQAEENKKALFDKGKESTDITPEEISSVSESIWATADSIFTDSAGDVAANTSVSEGGSNKNTTKNAKNSLSKTRKLLNSVESILINARDNIYITEYTTGMFSCYTTGVKAVDEKGDPLPIYTIAGNNDKYNLLSKDFNRLWRAEQEYVLWGNKDPVKDVNYTMMSIFGIRFALNLLYAFTGDAEIEATTLAWAVAIAGWTGFGVPIVQTVLKVALALAESTYDMTLLKKGEDLVIYKSADTWVMKPSGLSKEVIDNVANVAAKKAQGAINSAFNYVDKVTVDNINEVKESVASTVKSTQESLVGNAVDYVLAPFSNTFVSLVGKVEEDTKSALNNTLQTAKDNVDSSTTLGQLEKYLLDDYGTQIVEKLSEEITKTKNGATTKYDEVVSNLKQQLIDKANASELVTKLGDELTANVSSTLQNVNEQTQEAVGSAINESVSEFLNKAQGYGSSDKSSVTRGFALTMNYQEYVHMFLLLKGMGNSTKYLRRVAQLIQLNMEMRKGAFTLAKKYTLLQLNAEVQVNTVFFGKLDSFLDNPLNAKDTYTLKYCGLQGY